MDKKRSVGVTVIGVYLIFQAIIVFGHTELSPYNLLLSVLLLAIGIGLMKLYKPAYIVLIALSIIIVLGSLFFIFLLITNQSPQPIGVPLAGVIIFLSILFYLIRSKVKEQFK